MELRETTIEEGVRAAASCDTALHYIDYQPGNGCRYRLMFMAIGPDTSALIREQMGFGDVGGHIVYFLNQGSCMTFAGSSDFIAWDRVQKALRVSECDARVLAEFIAATIGKRAEAAGPIA